MFQQIRYIDTDVRALMGEEYDPKFTKVADYDMETFQNRLKNVWSARINK